MFPLIKTVNFKFETSSTYSRSLYGHNNAKKIRLKQEQTEIGFENRSKLSKLSNLNRKACKLETFAAIKLPGKCETKCYQFLPNAK